MTRRLIAATLLLSLLAPAAHATLIQPNSATATSEFSASYDIGNTIDGSGITGAVTPTSTHVGYGPVNFVNLYWTTQARTGTQITDGSTSATYTFTAPQSLVAFYLWNHQGSANGGTSKYYVTKFDLIFRDSSNVVLSSLLNLSAGNPSIAPISQKAEVFSFAQLYGVKTVQFVVRDSKGRVDNIQSAAGPVWYTGLAEVAFETPEPASLAIMMVGGAGLALRPRRHLRA